MPAQPPTFRTGTTAVVLDVVIRDRQGRPVRDIQPGELTVFEDGIAREIRSFRLIERTGSSTAGKSQTTADVPPDPLQYPTLVTLVFDHLGQNARTLARRAALQFVGRELPANRWAAVFGLEQRLRLEQAFTRDVGSIASAIERATGAPSAGRDRLAGAPGSRDDAAPGTAPRAATIPDRPGGDTAAVAAAVSQARVAEIIARMARMVETAEVQQRGQSTLFPLMALIKAQGALAGRKALVLFSEGLAIPPNLEDAYRSTISEANRANVSIYCVDARGLDVGRALDQARQMLDRSARNSQDQLVSGSSQRPVTLEDVMNAELGENALRADTQGALRTLAEETSGILIANTNDLGSTLAERVGSDLASYYELGYTPGPTAADGRFRAIEVKVARPGLKVHSRSGYYALPETDVLPVLPYELPMLAAAAASPPLRPFAYAAQLFRFEQSPGAVKYTLVVEVPLEHLTFEENRGDSTYALKFTTLALIKDHKGQVVHRFSETYPLQGPLDRVTALKRGRLRFRRHFVIPPGHYAVSVVARDQTTERSSVMSLPLEVTEPASGIRISDVSIIRSLDPAGAAPDVIEDPFRTDAVRVTPNLGLAISKATNPQVSAYLTIYPDGTHGAPQLAFEFMRSGSVIGRSVAELPPPDETGRIKFVASFPTSMFTPAAYTLRAVATQGAQSVSSETRFTLLP